jgi:hypothetical protein
MVDDFLIEDRDTSLCNIINPKNEATTIKIEVIKELVNIFMG